MFTNRDGLGAWANCCGPGVFRFSGGFGPKRRIVRKGELKFVLLRLLADEAMHGYELMRRLEEESGGLYTPSPGSVYPTLQLLEDQGYVSSTQEDGKRVYRLTSEGHAFLEEHGSRTRDIFGRLVNMGERFTGAAMREVTRSFIHLAQVSFERATGGHGDPETLARVKAILDRAAREIETAWPEPGSAVTREA
ncbi:PadR family transcriptional regulator [Candidatus Palauibacter sp.]|uniref:PadR family transcriptional regulator n=1 Tax=Candidatus Palauibacter sp. TaxID=3101350 RepID=UPI003C6FC9A6